MRACSVSAKAIRQWIRPTHPHFGAFNLPFVAVAFPASPLALKVVEDVGEVHLGLLRLRRGVRLAVRALPRLRPALLLAALHLLLLLHGLLLLVVLAAHAAAVLALAASERISLPAAV